MTRVFLLTRLLCLGVAAAGIAVGPALADSAGNWSGPYIGGFVGGGWSDFNRRAGSDGSFLGGGDVGNNWQLGHMVYGLEGDFSTLDNHVELGGIKFSEDWMSTVRGRAGFSIDRFLPYVTGGLALTDAVSKVSGFGSDERVQPGYAIGAGLDTSITDNWFGRIEYLHTSVPEGSTTIGGTTVSGGSGNNVVRVGLNYKF